MSAGISRGGDNTGVIGSTRSLTIPQSLSIPPSLTIPPSLSTSHTVPPSSESPPEFSLLKRGALVLSIFVVLPVLIYMTYRVTNIYADREKHVIMNVINLNAADMTNFMHVECQGITGQLQTDLQPGIVGLGPQEVGLRVRNDITRVKHTNARFIEGVLRTPSQPHIRQLNTMNSDMNLGGHNVLQVSQLEATRLDCKLVGVQNSITNLGLQEKNLDMGGNHVVCRTANATVLDVSELDGTALDSIVRLGVQEEDLEVRDGETYRDLYTGYIFQDSMAPALAVFTALLPSLTIGVELSEGFVSHPDLMTLNSGMITVVRAGLYGVNCMVDYMDAYLSGGVFHNGDSLPPSAQWSSCVAPFLAWKKGTTSYYSANNMVYLETGDTLRVLFVTSEDDVSPWAGPSLDNQDGWSGEANITLRISFLQ